MSALQNSLTCHQLLRKLLNARQYERSQEPACYSNNSRTGFIVNIRYKSTSASVDIIRNFIPLWFTNYCIALGTSVYRNSVFKFSKKLFPGFVLLKYANHYSFCTKNAKNTKLALWNYISSSSSSSSLLAAKILHTVVREPKSHNHENLPSSKWISKSGATPEK
jgi:hypothetical protein